MTITQIRNKMLSQLKVAYGVKFTAVKEFDSGKYKGLGDPQSTFRHVCYEVTAPGFVVKTAHIDIDYKNGSYTVSI